MTTSASLRRRDTSRLGIMTNSHANPIYSRDIHHRQTPQPPRHPPKSNVDHSNGLVYHRVRDKTTAAILHRTNSTFRTSRGIGLELTKQLLQSPSNVVLATCRSPSKADALQALTASSGGRLHVLPLDVDDAASITSAVQAAEKIVGDKGIDYLINNAGIVGPPIPLLTFALADAYG